MAAARRPTANINQLIQQRLQAELRSRATRRGGGLPAGQPMGGVRTVPPQARQVLGAGQRPRGMMAVGQPMRGAKPIPRAGGAGTTNPQARQMALALLKQRMQGGGGMPARTPMGARPMQSQMARPMPGGMPMSRPVGIPGVIPRRPMPGGGQPMGTRPMPTQMRARPMPTSGQPMNPQVRQQLMAQLLARQRGAR